MKTLRYLLSLTFILFSTHIYSQINCTPLSISNCNYIVNNTFAAPNYDPNDNDHVVHPFDLGLVTSWFPSHGTPQITDNVPGQPPWTGINYTHMESAHGGNHEGIYQKIPSLENDELRSGNYYCKVYTKSGILYIRLLIQR